MCQLSINYCLTKLFVGEFNMISKILGMSALVAGISFCQTVQAADMVGPGKITYIENGWDGEGVAIHSSINGPAGCTASLNDFGIEKSHAAYKELVAMALSAYTSNADVEIIVDAGKCVFGARTKVLSIRLKK
ncbi:hypothetical protein [Xanthomonas bonasiae]|uniref:hypothetical protein n=1 Tax=Xanthomonas bonasiae TaxID=2810351 RepID=UPI00197D0F39|nr:hypothetical protein [Xanthomonas bonasiae]MBN6112939.1 hypothetical protein [Xanthomonas bonasiae]